MTEPNHVLIEAGSRYLPEEERLMEQLAHLPNYEATEAYFAHFPNSERTRGSIVPRLRAIRAVRRRETLQTTVPTMMRLKEVVDRLEARKANAFGSVTIKDSDLRLLLDAAGATLNLAGDIIDLEKGRLVDR